MRHLFSALLLLSALLSSNAAEVTKVEPPNWWTGMNSDELQLMIYGKDLNGSKVGIIATDVSITEVADADSPDYLFVTLKIGKNQKPGLINLNLKKNGKSIDIPYELKERTSGAEMRTGFDSSDVIYLIMPDRFANGDETNDSVEGMEEQSNRNNPNGRHGGDIQGIISKLDYLKDLGVSTIWPTPLWESNHTKNSYHGYACTDYYKIDSRYGDNSLYKELASECHKRGIKLIMDVVPNHCSVSHPWMKNLPMADWIHPAPEAPGRTLAISAWNDPYVSELDFDLNRSGWFSALMPDMNQSNPKVLRYLIQNTIWWIEYANLDGLRVDTYPYCERGDIAKWTKALTDEYPKMNIVGEIWQPSASSIAYWQKDAHNADGYDSGLPCVMDFPLMDAMKSAFSAENTNRARHLNKIYTSLAQDYLYPHPDNIMIFADNHDTERFASLIGRDPELYKSAFGFLLTTRGIPQIYYGSEIMMDSSKVGIYTSNANRKDMPGGWKNDVTDVFTFTNQNETASDIFLHMKKLLNWRKQTPVVQNGKLMHFKPKDGTYVYFRYNDSECVMVAVNCNDEDVSLDPSRFSERLKGFNRGIDIMTGNEISLRMPIPLKKKTTTILQLKTN